MRLYFNYKNRRLLALLISVFIFTTIFKITASDNESKLRSRELGIDIGIFSQGKWNSITDVNGVMVGHKTIIKGTDIRTGVTVILPHDGNLFQEKIPAAVYSANAFGKLAGSTQVDELGEIETPIGLTNTLSVPVVVKGLVKYTLDRPGNENVRSVNAVVGETNDGYLNDIRGMHVGIEDVIDAINNARTGPVEEGNAGAGTGTICFGFKGGIGTSSRVLPQELGGYTVGVLVQTNFGGILTINGAPVGRELGSFYFNKYTKQPAEQKEMTSHKQGRERSLIKGNGLGLNPEINRDGDGSCMIVVATDAPLSHRNLKRLAKRAIIGLGRTGGIMSNGSGDYVIAFSTAYRIKSEPDSEALKLLSNDSMSPLFLAVIEATEEAIYNSLLQAKTMTGYNGNIIEAIPVDRVLSILSKYNLLNLKKKLPSCDH